MRRSFEAFLLAFIGSLAIVMAVVLIGKGPGLLSAVPEGGSDFEITIADFLLIVIFAPLIETVLLAAILSLLRLTGWSIAVVAAISGLIWGGLHALAWPFWFFGTVFGFFVFSCSYMTWRERSFGHAFAAGALPHIYNNLAVFAFIALVPE